jgi:hypothetical protein
MELEYGEIRYRIRALLVLVMRPRTFRVINDVIGNFATDV